MGVGVGVGMDVGVEFLREFHFLLNINVYH
jgi:hypothetical protein